MDDVVSKNCKVVFVGDSSVGKTTLINVLYGKEYASMTEPTITSSFVKIEKEFKGKNQIIQLWDTAGQEKYRNVVPVVFRNANIFVIVFSYGETDTMSSISKWLEILSDESNVQDICSKVVIVGNKLDLLTESIKNSPEYQNITNKYGHDYPLFNVSAKTGEYLPELMEYILKNSSDFEVISDVDYQEIPEPNTDTNKTSCPC